MDQIGSDSVKKKKKKRGKKRKKKRKKRTKKEQYHPVEQIGTDNVVEALSVQPVASVPVPILGQAKRMPLQCSSKAAGGVYTLSRSHSVSCPHACSRTAGRWLTCAAVGRELGGGCGVGVVHCRETLASMCCAAARSRSCQCLFKDMCNTCS